MALAGVGHHGGTANRRCDPPKHRPSGVKKRGLSYYSPTGRLDPDPQADYASNFVGAAIYIILLTAKGQAADKVRGDAVKANEYITKPFNPDEILQKARDILHVPPPA